MTEKTVDIPLLRKGLEWVEEQEALPVERRRWNQGQYVVSWRFFLDTRLTRRAFDAAATQPETAALLDCGTACCFAGYIAQEAEPGFTEKSIEYQNTYARDVAVDHLGITDGQARSLFDGDNSAAAVRRICEEIAGEPL